MRRIGQHCGFSFFSFKGWENKQLLSVSVSPVDSALWLPCRPDGRFPPVWTESPLPGHQEPVVVYYYYSKMHVLFALYDLYHVQHLYIDNTEDSVITHQIRCHGNCKNNGPQTNKIRWGQIQGGVYDNAGIGRFVAYRHSHSSGDRLVSVNITEPCQLYSRLMEETGVWFERANLLRPK